MDSDFPIRNEEVRMVGEAVSDKDRSRQIHRGSMREKN